MPTFVRIAGSGFVVATIVVGMADANPRQPLESSPTNTSARVRAPQISRRNHIARPSRNVSTPAPCATDFATYSLVGIATGNEEIAGGDFAGVASGLQNYACDADTGILTGESNSVGATGDGGDADWSAIGGGLENAILGGTQSFIGSGKQNSITGSESTIGSGEFNAVSGSFSSVSAGQDNTISGQISAIAAGASNKVAGGDSSFIGAGQLNSVNDNSGFVGAGVGDTITGDDSFAGAGEFADVSGISSFVGAGGYEFGLMCNCHTGTANGVAATDAFIGAGDLNAITGNGSFIGGGGYTTASKGTATPGNHISGADSFIGAGNQNAIAAIDGFVGSGYNNSISAAAAYGSIVGGGKNSASAVYATVIGGFSNTASGQYSIVAGGNSDTAAGTLTYAAGYHADAAHDGSFVWSDYVSGSTPVKDTATNQFVARASGGTYLYSNEAATTGVRLAPGSGTWASLSDRNAKTDIASVDDQSVLAKIASLPVTTWRYTSESGVRHLGPMAQDFYAAFGVGEDDRHITSIDEDGVAIAAVKGLNEKLERKTVDIRALQSKVIEVGRLRSEVADLRSELRQLESSIAGKHVKNDSVHSKGSLP